MNNDLISKNYSGVLKNISDVFAASKVEILAVTKNVDVLSVNYLISKGVNLIGENRVNELLEKYEYYNKDNLTIHFIGTLQTNKVKYIIDKVSMIQSCHSLKLAGVISELAIKNGKIMDILLQVNIGKEDTKSGFFEEEILETAYSVSKLKGVRLRGLMTIGTKNKGPIEFEKMRCLYSLLVKENINNTKIDTLSMGMSNDYIEAIKHGATIVRIGSGLFK